jgi:hypothetical protein
MGQKISDLELSNYMTHLLSYNMCSNRFSKKTLFFYKPKYHLFFLSEKFTEPNDPIITARNYLPKASFNITVSSSKKHFFCRFITEFVTLF